MAKSERVDILIDNESITQKIINAVGRGSYRNIKNMLHYLVSNLI